MILIKRCFCVLLAFILCCYPVFAVDFDFDNEEDTESEYESVLIDIIENQTEELQANIDNQTDDLTSAIQALADDLAENSPPASLDTSPVSFEADTALGHKIFYLPAGTVSNPFIKLDNGTYINGTNTTLYLFCPDYPSGTFSASRFNEFQYRVSNTSSVYSNLNLRNVTGLGLETSGSGVLDKMPVVLLTLISCVLISIYAMQFGRKL